MLVRWEERAGHVSIATVAGIFVDETCPNTSVCMIASDQQESLVAGDWLLVRGGGAWISPSRMTRLDRLCNMEDPCPNKRVNKGNMMDLQRELLFSLRESAAKDGVGVGFSEI